MAAMIKPIWEGKESTTIAYCIIYSSTNAQNKHDNIVACPNEAIP